MPTVNPDRVDIQQIVLNDIRERWRVGRERYGTGLQVGNGRDMTRDALEEVQDLLVYMTGMRERDAEIGRALQHLLDDVHGQLDGRCVTCKVEYPCHTAVDIDRLWYLLGGVRTAKVTHE